MKCSLAKLSVTEFQLCEIPFRGSLLSLTCYALYVEGCAMMAGFAAASHLDLVLSKLDSVAKMDSKRSSSFLDFFKVCIPL